MSVTTPPTRRHYRHASGLHSVSRELEALHSELLRSSGDDRHRVRTSVMNLVAACNDPREGERAAADLLAIGTRHPARAIVIVAQPDGETQLEADLSLHCSIDNRVCAELVRIDVRGEPAQHLTSIVEPLLIPDIPVHLWVVGAPPLRQAFSEATVALTESIILDSGAYTEAAETLALIARELSHFGGRITIADIAWERTMPWRQMLAHAFDAAESRPWMRHITAIAMRCNGDRVASDAWLVAGWLGSRLGWAAEHRPQLDVGAGAPQPDGGDAPPGSLLSLRVEARIENRSASVELERRSGVIHTSMTFEGAVTAERAVALPERDEPDLISTMMTEGGGDEAYRAATAMAAALASA